MRLKQVIIAQIVFLALGVVAGAMLNSDVADGPRTLHRLAGVLAGVSGLVATVVVFKNNSRKKIKGFVVGALVLTVVAAMSGSSLKTTDNYDKSFNAMRAAGTLALVSSVGSLVYVKKSLNSEAIKKESS